MRKFLISSKNFDGQVEVVFSESVLQTLSFADANIMPAQRKRFKEALPVVFSEFEKFVQQYKLVCVESDYIVPFDDFWNKYNKKLNKQLCLPIWAKMTGAERIAALQFIPKYNRFCERDGRARLDPVRYLKYKTWENEY